MKKLWLAIKEIVVLALWLVVAFVLLNYSYFWKQVSYFVDRQVLHHAAPSATPDSQFGANRIEITSLSIDAPLQYPTETKETVFQDSLAHGVTHYPNTALPGQLGNAYYFGHSSDFPNKAGNYKTVFALLPKIKKGDTVLISDDKGKVYTYKVVQTAVVAANDASVLSQGDNKQNILTLQTSYPVGTALERFVAQCELVE